MTSTEKKKLPTSTWLLYLVVAFLAVLGLFTLLGWLLQVIIWGLILLFVIGMIAFVVGAIFR